MKRTITTLFALLIGISFLSAQQIQRDNVLVEIATGTWCPYCPGAAMGADELIANGHDVAIIEHHGGDSYEYPGSSTRINYYSMGSFPSAVFDGGLKYVGGSATNSLYPQYLSRYNQKIDIPTSFSIEMEGTFTGMIDFDIDVTIEKVATYADDVRLFLVVTESEIEESWQGMDHLNFLNRLTVTPNSGMTLDFSGGNTVTENFTFSLDPSWVAEHCELVVFVQNYSTKEVQNAIKRNLLEFENLTDYDATMTSVSNLPEASCAGMITPLTEIRNFGNTDLTSLTLKCEVNGIEYSSYEWTGNLAFLERTEVELPAVSFPAEEVNTIKIYGINPNGNPDEYPQNDTIFAELEQPEPVPNDVSLMIMLDDHPEETTWEIMDDMGTVIYSGGPYSTPGGIVEESFILDNNACYQFYFYDAGGNGISDNFFALFHGGGTIILRGVGNFGSSIGTDFHTDDDVSVSEIALETDARVYPNPFSNYTNVVVYTNQLSHIKLNVFNILGETVYQSDEGMHSAGENKIRIGGEGLENGIYIVQIMVNDRILTRRITLAR